MFETAMFCDLMHQFCHRAYQNSKDKGFWKATPNFGEKYMLMVSELSELFEAHRKGKLTEPCDKNATIIDPTCTEPLRIQCERCAGSGKVHAPGESIRLPDLVIENTSYCPTCAGQGLIKTTGIRRLTNEEEEIADVAIRLADYCGYRGIDLGAVILSKMQYNSTRPYKHGKTC